MRVTTAFKRLLDLRGVTVTDVDFQPSKVVVTVKLRARRLCCPECDFSTKARYDLRNVASSWRHLDLGHWRLEVRAGLRRLTCPDHGVHTEGVPFARSGSRFTRDFEDLVGWLATTMDKTALRRLVRVDWDTVGRIIERVMESGLDPGRLDRLFSIGVDEVSWRKGHSYITLVSSHTTGKFVWGSEGKDTATLDRFFDELGPERSEAIEAISMDMGPAFEKSAKKVGHATKAVICYDPLRGIPRNAVLCAAPDYEPGGARHVAEGRSRPAEDCIIRGSEASEKGEQRVGRPIAPWLHVKRSGALERTLLDGEVAVEINPCGSCHVLVSQPECDH